MLLLMFSGFVYEEHCALMFRFFVLRVGENVSQCFPYFLQIKRFVSNETRKKG